MAKFFLNLIVFSTIVGVTTLAVWWIVNQDAALTHATSSPVLPHKHATAVKLATDQQSMVVWDDTILEHRFSGTASANRTPVVPQVPIPAPKPVTVPLTLEGTMVDESPGKSYAILQDASGREYVVKEGQSLPVPYQAIQLLQVGHKQVTLESSGASVDLPLRSPKGN